MNWEAIGAVGELIGSLAVLVTLVYLARQITHAREDVGRSINQSRAETVRQLLLTRATSSHLRNAYVKAYLGLGGHLRRS
jgi:hypothetical protein